MQILDKTLFLIVAFAPDPSNKCFSNCFISSILIYVNIPGFLLQFALWLQLVSHLVCPIAHLVTNSTFKYWTWIMLIIVQGVDQILEAEGIPLVRIDNPVEAEKWGLEVIHHFYFFHKSKENIQKIEYNPKIWST